MHRTALIRRLVQSKMLMVPRLRNSETSTYNYNKHADKIEPQEGEPQSTTGKSILSLKMASPDQALCPLRTPPPSLQPIAVT